MENEEDNDTPHLDFASETRYWSDYDRVYYHPRSLQRLPDIPDYENAEGDWQGSLETFTKFNDVRKIGSSSLIKL